MPSVVQVEAAFLVNFLRYTDWPTRSFAGPDDPYIITVVGSADVAAAIATVATAAGEIRGRRIEVRRAVVDTPGDRAAAIDRLRDSHLVFVHSSAVADADVVLAMVRGQPVLTVGDLPDFAGEGGMLGLVQSRSHLAFEANPSTIQGAGLLVSAKVLKLARIRGAKT